MIGGPEPSVLEAMALRLFQRWNIPVLGREQHIYADGRYRIDFIVGPRLIVEVDGFAYHWTPEAKAYDDRRRNRLRAVGMTVLVYDWRSVKFEAGRLAKEVRQAQTTVISHATVASHAS
jgi:very-short-patch-repair endonuclease